MKTKYSSGLDMLPGQPVRQRWWETIEEVLNSNRRRIMVIGPADAGKSTFCLLLMQAMQSAGREACLLDTDVGQKLVGPPACVTVGRSGSAGDLTCSRICFVGATSPVAGWKRLIGCLAAVIEELGDHTFVVNTSGLLGGPGQRLKDQKISVVKPELLVAIGDDPQLDTIVTRHAGGAVHRLPSAPERRRKTPSERAAARRTAFRSYFSGSRSWKMARSALEWEPGSPGTLPPPGLLVGISDATGRDLAIAIVTDSDPSTGSFTLFCPKAPKSGLQLKWGRIRLNEFVESPLDPSGMRAIHRPGNHLDLQPRQGPEHPSLFGVSEHPKGVGFQPDRIALATLNIIHDPLKTDERRAAKS